MYMIINERCPCSMHFIQFVVIVFLYVAYSVVVVQENMLFAVQERGEVKFHIIVIQ